MKNLTLALLGLTVLGTPALADSVSASVRTETSNLARQYAGSACRSDYDVDTERFHRTLSAAQIRESRTRICNEWKSDLAEEAREDGGTYRIGFENNRVWAWYKEGGKTEFKTITIGASNSRELSCDL